MNKENAIPLYRLTEGTEFTVGNGAPVYTVERVNTNEGWTRVVYTYGPVRAEFTKSSLFTVYI